MKLEVFKCDSCGRDGTARGNEPLHYPKGWHQEKFGAEELDLCEDCSKKLNESLEEVKVRFSKFKRRYR